VTRYLPLGLGVLMDDIEGFLAVRARPEIGGAGFDDLLENRCVCVVGL
jgi:hypothetical protein